ncbi:sugar phosphate isomerase/epimerase family protein [Methanosphaera sp. ISO3-F5]|uniref:sugar phosphate isomerase/epimerase family protein n=1 Tax=Methanosphaera sp. ISO3-F5 TaxID=1452353 RepID=UPI002B25F031|nr:sugar phosphate isomerase/epimerase family protein [Methanosphaera sp. ISO3-F5]WQH63298.1 sugar phosphate isomerase/epimerase [Methanosphaera sp. ISO3-F5]
MKISVSTLGLYPAKIENILDFVTGLKLDYLEIITEYPYKHVTYDDVSNYDLGISVHAPMSDINIASHIDKIRDASNAEMVSAFRKANELDANRVTVHPGSIPVMALKFTDKILEYNLESLKYLQSQAEEYGVMMCVENMPLLERLLYTNIEALYDLVDNELHSGITLDVGHAHNNGFSVDEMFMSDSIHHIHLSDNDGSYDMHDALGTHNIDFEGIFNILEKQRYDDICVIEVYSVNQIRKSVDYLKEINVL